MLWPQHWSCGCQLVQKIQAQSWIASAKMMLCTLSMITSHLGDTAAKRNFANMITSLENLCAKDAWFWFHFWPLTFLKYFWLLPLCQGWRRVLLQWQKCCPENLWLRENGNDFYWYIWLGPLITNLYISIQKWWNCHSHHVLAMACGIHL